MYEYGWLSPRDLWWWLSPRLAVATAGCRYGWLSTRGRYDGGGQGGGVGSGQAFSAKEYGPGGSHVDTNKPFKASVSFPTDGKG